MVGCLLTRELIMPYSKRPLVLTKDVQWSRSQNMRVADVVEVLADRLRQAVTHRVKALKGDAEKLTSEQEAFLAGYRAAIEDLRNLSTIIRENE